MSALDIERALERAREADLELGRIALLPRLIGARIKWHVNGMTWERVGEDAWRPTGDAATYFPPTETWPSSHIASDNGWDEVDFS